jgi:hypothetical protein
MNCLGAGRSADWVDKHATGFGGFQNDFLIKNCTVFWELGKEFILWNIGGKYGKTNQTH